MQKTIKRINSQKLHERKMQITKLNFLTYRFKN